VQKRERRAGLAKDRLEREGVWTIPGYDFPDREFSEYGTTGPACKSDDGYRSDSVKTGSRCPIPMKSESPLPRSTTDSNVCTHSHVPQALRPASRRSVLVIREGSQTREHLFCHCRKWKNAQQVLWKAAGRATDWKVRRCRHVQILELLSL